MDEGVGRQDAQSSDEDGSWQTTASFLAHLLSTDNDRITEALSHFLAARYDSLWKQIRAGISGYPGIDGGEILNSVIERLYKELAKGWRPPVGIKFRSCIHQWVKFAIESEIRELARNDRRMQQVNETAWDAISHTLDSFFESFILKELLNLVQDRIRAEFSQRDWGVWDTWRIREDCWWKDEWDTKSAQQVAAVCDVTTTNERKIRQRIRHRLREEIEQIARRKGWEIDDLFR